MKRKIRIFRIWLCGRHKLMKAIHRYRRGQLFRDLNFIIPDYIPEILAKYGDTSWGDHYLEFGEQEPKTTQP